MPELYLSANLLCSSHRRRSTAVLASHNVHAAVFSLPQNPVSALVVSLTDHRDDFCPVGEGCRLKRTCGAGLRCHQGCRKGGSNPPSSTAGGQSHGPANPATPRPARWSVQSSASLTSFALLQKKYSMN